MVDLYAYEKLTEQLNQIQDDLELIKGHLGLGDDYSNLDELEPVGDVEEDVNEEVKNSKVDL